MARSKIVTFAAILALVFALQWFGGAFTEQPVEGDDEIAHFMTALMVRDYVVGHLGEHPLRFAENYYLHYPKIALGHWPPVFYAVLAPALVFFPSYVAVFLCLGLIAAGFAFRIFQTVRAQGGPIEAWSTVVLFLFLYPVVAFSRVLMCEILMAWLMFEAVLAFGRWLEAPGLRNILPFALFASLAILTKAVALGILFLPPVAILMFRRPRLLVNPSMIAGAAIVLALCGPWYAFAPGARHEAAGNALPGLLGTAISNAVNGSTPSAQAVVSEAQARTTVSTLRGLAYRWSRATEAFWVLWVWMGPAVFAGALGLLILTWRGNAGARLWLAFVLGFIAFRFVLLSATWASRMSIPLVAVFVCFVGAGLKALPIRRPEWILALLAVLNVGWTVADLPVKSSFETAKFAEWMMSDPGFKSAVVLVSADPGYEASVISEIAMRDRNRPQHYVLRAGKLMALSSWDGGAYRKLVEDQTGVFRLLDAGAVDLLVLQRGMKYYFFHHTLLQWTAARNPSRFRRVPLDAKDLEVYQVLGNPASDASTPHRRPNVSMQLLGLGKTLEAGVP